jgi:ParB family chromosome partitioning protein
MTGSTNKRRGLGRGLGALIVDTAAPTAPPTAEATAAPGIHECPIDHITPNPHQPRAYFDETALTELAASIQTHGIIQPLVVTADPQQSDRYWLVAGERRWRAAQRANLSTVPIIVREASSQQLVEWALVENVQRADLNPLEEGAAYQTLIEEFGLTHAEVAERVGKSRSAVSNTLRLLQAPAAVQDAVTAQLISAGHARALLALEETERIEAALSTVLTEELNVRQTEALVKVWLTTPVTDEADANREEDGAQEPDPYLPHAAQVTYMEDRLRSTLGTRVNLKRNANGSGRLVIHFYNDEDLDAIYRVIAGHSDGDI